MQEKYQQLKTLLSEIWDLTKAQAVLNWDRQTKMPPNGTAARTRQTSTLSRVIHGRYTSEEMGRLLEALVPWLDELDFNSDEAALIRLAQREFHKRTAVPAELVAAKSKASGEANAAWLKARKESDFSSFIPHLECLFDLAIKYAECFPEVEHPYDALLDQFEPGMTVKTISRIFNQVKGPQTMLLKAIKESDVIIDSSLLNQHFPQDKQLKAALEAAQTLGYDLDKGRLDLTTHPFSTSFGVNDVRITTRVNENYLNACLFATMHESGHALYELGVSHSFEGLPLARGASSGIHESQSRLFENLIGRSRAFSSYLFPILQNHFPSQLGNADLDAYYQAINKVQPSFIRVEADEVSYNLHIILRFEIELGVLNGDIPIQELPEVWNEKFNTYFGIIPTTDREGILQDVHWSWGLIGHFTSYAMGNIIASQWWHQMAKEIPNQDELMAQGKLDPIREWLIENVQKHGRKYLPNELIQRVTGGSMDTAPYLAYLESKYKALYHL
jgi:carboxypeptidase Taq